MHNTLLQIVEKKKKDIEEKKGRSVFAKNILQAESIAFIAEIKLASPTHPSLGTREEIVKRAKKYEQSGADAVSVITESHYFKGSPGFISEIREQVALPLLQKDFVIDPYQIYEAKIIGSDAILLIARLVDKKTLQEFVTLAQQLGVEPVVEINDEEDLEKALVTKTAIIAVNARDLETFATDLEKACALLQKIPNTFIKLGFSGIHSRREVEQYKNAGAKGVLVGTSLMQTENIHDFINDLKRI